MLAHYRAKTGPSFNRNLSTLTWALSSRRLVDSTPYLLSNEPGPVKHANGSWLLRLPGARDPDAFVFARYAEGQCAYSLATCWRAVCAGAKLGGTRLHDLRHSAASHAVMSGEQLAIDGQVARAPACLHVVGLCPSCRWASAHYTDRDRIMRIIEPTTVVRCSRDGSRRRPRSPPSGPGGGGVNATTPAAGGWAAAYFLEGCGGSRRSTRPVARATSCIWRSTR